MAVSARQQWREEKESFFFFIPCVFGSLRQLSKPHRNSHPKSGTIWQSGNCCQNLARGTGTPCQIFWKSKNLAQKNNLARGSPQSGNNLATIWQRSGNKKMEKTHLAQFKKPPSVCVNLSSGGEGRFQYYQCKTALPYYFLTIVLFVIMTSKYHYT
jgi:hypothetical protein